MATRTVSGFVTKPNGDIYPGAVLTIQLIDAFGVDVGSPAVSQAVDPQRWRVVADEDGFITVDILVPDTGTVEYRFSLPNERNVPAFLGDGAAIDLGDIFSDALVEDPGLVTIQDLIADLAVALGPATALRNVIQPSADVVGLTVRGHLSATARLQEWQLANGTVAVYIGADGVLHGNGSGLTGLTGASLVDLDASELTTGTVPNGRFPSTLPALSGVNLTALNASNLGSGTVPLARLAALTQSQFASAAVSQWTNDAGYLSSAAADALFLTPAEGNAAYQPLAAKLTSLGALTWGADLLPYFTSTSAVTTTGLSAFARTVLDDADAGAFRTTLGAASLAANTFSGAQLLPAGSLAAPSLAVGAAGTGLYNSATGALDVTLSGTRFATFLNSNKSLSLGIPGTDEPRIALSSKNGTALWGIKASSSVLNSVRDDTLAIGYNLDRENAGEIIWNTQFEANYKDVAADSNVAEWILSYSGLTAVSRRPIQANVYRQGVNADKAQIFLSGYTAIKSSDQNSTPMIVEDGGPITFATSLQRSSNNTKWFTQQNAAGSAYRDLVRLNNVDEVTLGADGDNTRITADLKGSGNILLTNITASGPHLVVGNTSTSLTNGGLEVYTNTGNVQLRIGATANYYDIGRSASTSFLEFAGSQTGFQGYAFTDGSVRVTRAGIGVTSTDGLLLQNSTAAALGAQQWSPRLHLLARGWATSGSASQLAEWILENQAVQGSSNPSSLLMFSSSINGAGYTARFWCSSSGQFRVPNETWINSLRVGGGYHLAFCDAAGSGSLLLNLSSGCQYTIGAGGNAGSFDGDVGWARLSAGIFKITNGGASYGTLDALAYKVSGVAGIDFSGPVTNITVAKGMITAAS